MGSCSGKFKCLAKANFRSKELKHSACDEYTQILFLLKDFLISFYTAISFQISCFFMRTLLFDIFTKKLFFFFLQPALYYVLMYCCIIRMIFIPFLSLIKRVVLAVKFYILCSIARKYLFEQAQEK